MSLYEYSFQDQNGNTVSMEDYRGKVLLIVNTATGCGFTPQYEDLQAIYDACHDKGLEILDFPCNQFGNQAPGSDEEIHDFCTGRYGITFPQFAKVDVNGENALPLFDYLTSHTKFAGFGINPMGLFLSQMLKKADPNFASNPSVKWNFTKFLVNRDGEIVARFEPTTAMKTVRAKVEACL